VPKHDEAYDVTTPALPRIPDAGKAAQGRPADGCLENVIGCNEIGRSRGDRRLQRYRRAYRPYRNKISFMDAVKAAGVIREERRLIGKNIDCDSQK